MDANQFKPASLILRPGNVVAWLHNQRMQQMEPLNLPPSTKAGILKRLENKSLIIRKTDEKDGRNVVITPTKESLAHEDYLKETAAQTEEILLQRMTKAEQNEFYRLLKIALENANAVKKSGGCKNDK
nr:hypothetical protein [uncultured Gemmiger sp.]